MREKKREREKGRKRWRGRGVRGREGKPARGGGRKRQVKREGVREDGEKKEMGAT